jgi:hypothetical protein
MEDVRLKQVKEIILIKIKSLALGLSEIPENSIHSELINKTTVRLTWSKHPFSVQIRLKNLETNLFKYPTKSNHTNAIFVNLTEASIYQVQFNISKPSFPSINQTTEHHIETGKSFPMFSKNIYFF